MATVSFIKETKQSISAMRNLMVYCVQEKKVFDPESRQRLVSGVNCDGENAFVEFMATKETYRKTDGINFYQYVQSFSPRENISAEEAHQIGLEFAEKAWPGHEVLVATHCDAPHPHSHFVINSVSFETGYKLRQHPNTLKTLRELSDGICQAYGLSVLKPYEKDGTRLSTREYRAAKKKQSWKFKLMAEINSAMNKSGTPEEFIRQLQGRGYDVLWTPQRKYITFTCPGGMKCRDIKLHDEKYRKENLENEFRIREQITKEFGIGYADGDQRRGGGELGADPIPARGLRDPGGIQGRNAGAASGISGIPTDVIPADRIVSDADRIDGSRYADPKDRNGLYEQNRSIGEDGEPRDCPADAGEHPTGWERSREIFLGTLRRVRRQNQQAGRNSRPHAPKNTAHHDRSVSLHCAPLHPDLHGLLAFGQLINDDSEDEEERHRRIEAEEAGSNLGAAIGLAAGLISAALDDETDDLPAELEAEQNEMKMNF